MANRFYTLMVVPERTSKIRKFIIPSWVLRGSVVALIFFFLLASILFYDYWKLLNQISENKDLRLENRRLVQQVQIYKNRMESIDRTLDRIETFATRLKIITNIEDRGSVIEEFQKSLPDSAENINKKPDTGSLKKTLSSLDLNPEVTLLKHDYEELEDRFSLINTSSLKTEQNLLELHELLIDQRDFLAALPTRQPSIGELTSGFGVRRSPFGGRVKMHEGLDIANFAGTPIRAPANGEVVYAGLKPGYGRTVILDHGYGLETWYGHISKINVKLAQKVTRGDFIATIGNTGRSTGSHVHYEVRVNGIPVDPLTYILEQ